MSTLYLIPTPIVENGNDHLPPATVEICRNLDYFIVERAKTARHFVKSLQPGKAISEMTFVEIDRENPAVANQALSDAVALKKDIGLLSEAGCPAVADPGAELVLAAHRMGIPVVPLPGPSSILLAVMASGMNGQNFAFNGYLTPKRPELAAELRKLEQWSFDKKQTQFFMETPYRTRMVLEVAFEALQAHTLFGIAAGLTGPTALVKTMTTAQWKKQGYPPIDKLPTIFSIYRT